MAGPQAPAPRSAALVAALAAAQRVAALEVAVWQAGTSWSPWEVHLLLGRMAQGASAAGSMALAVEAVVVELEVR